MRLMATVILIWHLCLAHAGPKAPKVTKSLKNLRPEDLPKNARLVEDESSYPQPFGGDYMQKILDWQAEQKRKKEEAEAELEPKPLSEELKDNAEDGDPESQFQLGEYWERHAGRKKDDARAASWYKLAIAQGHACAMFALGSMTLEERGGDVARLTTKDAFSYVRKSAEGGCPKGMLNYGMMRMEMNETDIHDSTDPVEAVEWFKKAAASNSSDAMEMVAWAFRRGVGVKKNGKVAAGWLRKAALQNSSTAMADLGDMYNRGDGLRQHEMMATEWMAKAAALENARGQYHMGVLFHHGEGGMKKDLDAALDFFRKAGLQNLTQAQYATGLMYKLLEGESYLKNDPNFQYKMALAWFEKAAEQGHHVSMKHLSQMFGEGLGLEGKPDHEKSIKWLTRLANETSDPMALHYMGIKYAFGQGIARDPKEAMKWYLKATEHNITKAWHSIGQLQQSGQGTKQDYKKAMESYRKAAVDEDEGAMFSIGSLYVNGLGVEINNTIGADWYRKAAKQNSTDAMYNLGLMYQEGRGLKQDNQTAARWYKKATELGDAEATFAFAMMIKRGTGVTQNQKRGAKYLKKAVEMYHPVAMHQLAQAYEKGVGVEENQTRAKILYIRAWQIFHNVSNVSQYLNLTEIFERNLTHAVDRPEGADTDALDEQAHEARARHMQRGGDSTELRQQDPHKQAFSQMRDLRAEL